MGDRSALIITTSSYQDPGLRQLRAPTQDAEELTGVLEASTIGGFQVRPVLDKPSYEIAFELENFFADRSLDDLLLVHLSCHGIKDDEGRLFFAATNTQRRRLGSTAISSAFLNELMEACRARSIVLLLDCCYSGAFRPGSKAGPGVQLKERLEGQGRAVMTASTELEYAWEGEQLTGQAKPSLFTGAIVEGLRSGEADRDRDGMVSVTDLYSYVHERVRASKRGQTPKLWALGIKDNVYVARNPLALKVAVIDKQPQLFVSYSERADRQVLDIIHDVLEGYRDKLDVTWGDTVDLMDTDSIAQPTYGICYFSERVENPTAQVRFTDDPSVVLRAGMIHAMAMSADRPAGWIPIRERQSPESPLDFAIVRTLYVPRTSDDEVDHDKFKKELARRVMMLLLTETG